MSHDHPRAKHIQWNKAPIGDERPSWIKALKGNPLKISVP